MTPQHIGKTSEREMNELAEESYRQITGQNPMTPQQEGEIFLRILLQEIKKEEFKPYMNHPKKAVWFEDIKKIVQEQIRSRPTHSLTENQKLSKEMREASELYRAGLKEGAAQAREDVLDALDRDWKGRYVEDAVAEIRRFPESLRTGGDK